MSSFGNCWELDLLSAPRYWQQLATSSRGLAFFSPLKALRTTPDSPWNYINAEMVKALVTSEHRQRIGALRRLNQTVFSLKRSQIH
jgi:hypothetical protein